MNLGNTEKMQEGTISEDVIRLMYKTLPDTEKIGTPGELFNTLLRYEYDADNSRDYDLYSRKTVDAVDAFLNDCVNGKYQYKISRLNKNKCMDVIRSYLTSKGLRT